jgi:ABC-type Fe3+/spermidine/putrescine transport system ATPase subunit
MFCLLGPSGCGKTTLLRVLAGLETPDEGRVAMDGRDVTALAPERRPTAMVFQNYALFPHLTVEGNVAFGLKLRRMGREAIRAKVAETLARVQLGGFETRRMSELSGGQQQRVALARVLAIEPRVLLMDEPLSNLDAALRRSTRTAIRRIQTELKLTLIYVTHDQEEALMMSDRLALMDAGRLIQVGTPRELYERPATIEAARFLGERNIIAAFVTHESDVALAIGPSPESPDSLIVPKSNMMAPVGRGDAVWLAARPDEFEPAPKDAVGPAWSARLVLRTTGGLATDLEMELDGTEIAVRVSVAHDRDGTTSRSTDVDRDRTAIRLKANAGLVFSRP